MAVSVVSWTPCSDYGATGNSVTVSWSTGDLIVVAATSPYAADDFNTPTATGLTFTQQSIVDGGAGTESKSAMWTAVAASAGSSVAVSVTTTLPYIVGMCVWVLSGAGAVTGITGDSAEQAFPSVTVGDGDAVLVYMGDYLAATPTRSPTTGSGTATERVDNGTAPAQGGYGVWAADWIGCTAGTYSFGATSYAGTRDAQVGIVVSGFAAATDQTAYRFGLDDGTETGHSFAAAENTTVSAGTAARRLLRVQVNDTAGGAGTGAYTLQYKRSDEADTEWRSI